MARKPSQDNKATAKQRVCDSCGTLNSPTATKCSQCGGSRWAPEWVKQLRRVNKSLSVQVADSHPLSKSDQPRLTLYKWWPGNRSTFNINTSDQWEAIKHIVDTELASFLGWNTPEEVAEQLEAARKKSQRTAANVDGVVGGNPGVVVELLKKVKFDAVAQEDLPQLGAAIADIAEILVGIDESHRSAIQQIVKKLPAEPELAIRQLSALMEELTITQITAVTSEVQRRVGLLKVFRDRVLDERTYEIRGDGSIHRLLEQAMWIVDERYWLMHSNRQLRTVVTKALEKEDKKYKTDRPDFVCGAVDKKLIIIEIKRPSHMLTVADLNQLERYVVLCEEYETDHKSFEAILVGSKKSSDLDRTLKVRGSRLGVRTYTDLIGDTERRYKRYLDALDGSK